MNKKIFSAGMLLLILILCLTLCSCGIKDDNQLKNSNGITLYDTEEVNSTDSYTAEKATSKKYTYSYSGGNNRYYKDEENPYYDDGYNYEDGYDDVYFNEEYDEELYDNDSDYAQGVDDAMDDMDEDW